VSDEIVCEAVGARIKNEAHNHGLILDGFPRTVRQADCLSTLLGDLGLPEPLVIYLDVSRDLLVRRLTARRQCAVCGAVYNLVTRPSLCGPRCENDGGLLVERDDDAEAVVMHRFEEFDATSAPLVDYYRKGDFHRIDGDGDLDAIRTELTEVFAHDAVCSRA
jgi:adenylate kinase